MANMRSQQRSATDIKLYPPRYKFSWRVDNFSKICPQGTTAFPEIRAPSFTTRTPNDVVMEWDVSILGSGGMMYCSLSQRPLSSDCDLKKLNGFGCTLQTFLGNNEHPSCYEAGSRTFKFPSRLENSRHSLVSIDHLYEKKETLLREGSLNFYLHAQLISPEGVKSPLHFKQQEEDARVRKLVMDFQGLLDTKKNCDIELRCDGTSFKCHKLILAARSPVFSAMLYDRDNLPQSVIMIDDMKPPAVAAMLKYVYTGTVDPPIEFGGWTTLIHAADRFELKEWKDYCFHKMFENVTAENVGWLAVAAHTHNADEEFKHSIKSYCKTHIAQLLEIPTFRELFSKHIDAFY